MKKIKAKDNTRNLSKVVFGRHKAMFGITRIDQEENGTYGYYFRVKDGGVLHQKYFSDNKHGGKAAALKAVKAHREAVLSRASEAALKRAATNKRLVPQSGVANITHVVANCVKKKYYYWQATWINLEGLRRCAKYSINKYGSDKAMDLAKKRLKKEIKLKKQALKSS